MSNESTPRGWSVFTWLLLAADGAVAALYFYAEWQIYAQHHGATPDMGTALGAAFTSAFAVNASLILLAVTLIAVVAGRILKYRTGWLWVALAVTCSPMAQMLVFG
jgi:hypothetical protein